MKSVCRALPDGRNISSEKWSRGSAKTGFARFWGRPRTVRGFSNWLTRRSNTRMEEVWAGDTGMTVLLMRKVTQLTRCVTKIAIRGSRRAAFSLTFLAALILILSGSSAWAQAGAAISGQAILPSGPPAAFAQITVCPYNATGVPCTPLSTIYSDSGLTTPLTQPFSADQHGNYSFWVASNTSYLVQVAISPFSVPYSYFYTSGGTGGGGSTVFVGGTPSGTINGTNTVFTISSSACVANSVLVWNNYDLVPQTGWSLSGTTLTYTSAPQVGDVLYYQCATQTSGGGGGGAPAAPLGVVQTQASPSTFGASPPINCGQYANNPTCLAAAQLAGANAAISIPVGGGASPAQNVYSQATATCIVDPTTQSISIYPVNYGQGYISGNTYTATTTTLPSGAALGTVTSIANSSGQLTSWTITGANSGFPVSGIANVNSAFCPIFIIPPTPPTVPATLPVINYTWGANSYVQTVKLQDVGAYCDGTHDDANALTRASELATNGGAVQGVVEFPQGKSCLIGSINGNYGTAGDDGTVPSAGSFTCTTSAGGAINTGTGSCTANTGINCPGPLGCVGYGLLSGQTPLNFPGSTPSSNPSVTLTLANCNSTNCPAGTNYGTYISSLNVTGGGAGFPPSSTVQLLVGPTCNSFTTPCYLTTPEPRSFVNYGSFLYTNTIIRGNGATLLGSWFGSAITAPTYTDTVPYMALVTMASNVRVYDLNCKNALVCFGNLNARERFEKVNFTTVGCGFQAVNTQESYFIDIQTGIQASNNSLFCVGGQWVTRAPFTGTESNNALNNFNLIDGLMLDNSDPFGGGVFGSGTTTCNWIAFQAGIDNWFNSKFFHSQDWGFSPHYGTPSCPWSGTAYSPPGGTVRVTDQDITRLNGAQWQGVAGHTVGVFYSVLGRPMLQPIFTKVQPKASAGEALVVGPGEVGMITSGFGSETAGFCDSSLHVYGSISCPNPYQTNIIAPPSYTMVSTPQADSLCNQVGVTPYSLTIGTDPNAPTPVNGISGFPNSSVSYDVFSGGTFSGTSGCSQSELVNAGSNFNRGAAGATNAQISFEAFSPAEQVTNAGGFGFTTSSSPRMNFVGEINNGAVLKTSTWSLFSPQGAYAPVNNAKAWFTFENYAASSPSNVNAAVSMPGILVHAGPVQGGQVTGFTVTNYGSGYPFPQVIPCFVDPSPVNSANSSTVFYQADCVAHSTYSGGITIPSAQTFGLGYASPPNVYVSPPGAAIYKCTPTGGVPTSCTGLTFGTGVTTTTVLEAQSAGTGASYTVNLTGTQVTSVTVSGGSGYTNPYYIFAGTNGGTAATATAQINAIETRYPIEDLEGCPFFLPGSAVTLLANQQIPYTGITCTNALFNSARSASGHKVTINANGNADGNTTGLGLQYQAYVTANNTITLIVQNPTGNSQTFQPGTSTNPWIAHLESFDSVSDVSVAAASGTAGNIANMGGSTPYSQTITAAAATTGQCVEQTFTVTGIVTGRKVAISPGAALGAHVWIGWARASAANTIAIGYCADSTGGTPASSTYQIAQ